ncbi:MAG: helix-turn-helix domain-containing protein [Clostridium sp.]|uniref:helix-turn-helix domain-containing protein n=1 Tax=Clostridium sp. TaxID=1506 RepID=UPI0025BBA7BD|nr:helix-turn-helix domain-containing protein [Clostridium sp.]MBS5926243.1 helix-turn-helix domain-containing protein [Clostridium sp.]
MFNISYEKCFYESISDLPIMKMTNLKKIKNFFNLTDKQLSSRLGINIIYLNNVMNGRGILSGKTTIRLLNELKIDFNCIYNREEVEYEKESCIGIVISSDSDLTEDEKEDIAMKVFSKYDNNNKSIYIPIFKDIEEKNDFINLNKITREELSFLDDKAYKELFENFNNARCHNVKKYTYLIIGVVKEVVDENIKYDYSKNIDLEKVNVLMSIPFKKIKKMRFTPTQYNVEDDKVILDNKYNVITASGLQNKQLLSSDEYSELSKNCIRIYTLSNEKAINKLKHYRIIYGYTYEEMAEMLNLTKDSYRAIESSYQKISTSVMYRIENVLGVTLESILDTNVYCKKFCK